MQVTCLCLSSSPPPVKCHPLVSREFVWLKHNYLPETYFAWNTIILLEKQWSCLKNHYFAWDIIILQQKLVFLEHKPRTKESSLILFWLSNPGRGLKGASGMTSFGSEAKFLSAPCFCAWAYLIFASSHLHLHRYPHLNVITLKFAGQIFVQGDTFIWQHVHEVVLPRFVEQILLQIYVIFKRKVN